ncbi:DUF503 family protein [Nitratiruptor sp. YY09-18]|uniref:DUF503 family protein n=1 Tax=Nitratiruptor sp. YY09-18 TaxID=2724901 RepID=UPI001915DCAE|nr:DUF503 family protein [Nitratiruptor sp. YY09-18]BCD67983.1 hypothetical protein NitYY0918_C0892 [Nitratiruptor sp. YY09-18]
MLIIHALITLDLPYITSLKGRRKILQSIKEKLKNKNVAVADLSGEYAKEGLLELVFFASSQNDANNKIQNLHKFLDDNFPDIRYTLEYEIV